MASIRSGRLTVALVMTALLSLPGCSKGSGEKKSAKPGVKRGKLTTGQVCKRAGRIVLRQLKLEYDDGAESELGCGLLLGTKEARADRKVSPVAAVMRVTGEPTHPDINVRFYDARGRKLKRLDVDNLETAFLYDERFLVYVTAPPTFNRSCEIWDVKKKRAFPFKCQGAPRLRGDCAVWWEDDHGKRELHCLNLKKRRSRRLGALPELKETKLRWVSERKVEASGVETKTGKPFQATHVCD